MAAVLVALSFHGQASAQIYPNRVRSQAIEWEELRSETFRILYPRHAYDAAARTAALLDWQYPVLAESIGGTLSDFPIVLNAGNSLSNGYVTTLLTRSEIELRPIKGKTLNPRSGGWLETVVPHELVHAVHFGVRPRWSPTNLIDLVSPDLTRSVHSAVPLGFHEGIAVDHESEGVYPGAGRANYAYFNGRFSAVDEVSPWSMGQLFHTSTVTLPYDRHYLGGTAFMQWFRTTYGQEAVQELIRRHYHAPFLGFGVAMLGTTGLWPSQLYRQFRSDLEAKDALSSVVPSSAPADEVLFAPPGWKGTRIGRPMWVDPNTLLVHASSYNAPDGFYEFKLDGSRVDSSMLSVENSGALEPKSGSSGEVRSPRRIRLVHEARSVGDLVVTFNPDSSQLWYAAYTPDRRFDEVWGTELRGFDVPSDDPDRRNAGSFTAYESDADLFAPTWNRSHKLALLDSLDTPSMVVLGSDPGILDTLHLGAGTVPVQVEMRPGHSDSLAVLARKGRMQGVWIVDHPRSILEILEGRAPDLHLTEGAVLDISWHPSGERLAFTADSAGTLSIFELDLPSRTVRPLVHTRRNAFEPSYSPDGTRLAYIRQHIEEQHLAILTIPPLPDPASSAPSSPASSSPEPDHRTATRHHPADGASTHDAASPVHPAPPLPGAPLPDHWERSPLGQSMRWLRPRLVLPYAADVAGSDETEFGLQIASSDILRENTYFGSFTYLEDRIWSDFRYRYSGFWPGFSLSLKSRPSYLTFRLPGSEGETFLKDYLMREQSVGFSNPFEWNLSDGIHRSSRLRIEPSVELGQSTLHIPGDAGAAVSDGIPLRRIGVFASWSRNLRQFDRDMMPNAGRVFYLQTDRDAETPRFEFEADGKRYRGQFAARYGVRAGVSGYFPIASKRNQTGRIRLEWIRQSTNPYYSIRSLTRGLVQTHPVAGSGQGFYGDLRLTMPLAHPDQGGLTVPFYLGSVYLASYTRAFLPMEAAGFTPVPDRTAVGTGIGLRTRFRISNLLFDAGIGVFYNLRNQSLELDIGEF